MLSARAIEEMKSENNEFDPRLMTEYGVRTRIATQRGGRMGVFYLGIYLT